MSKTDIQWADWHWEPVGGCTDASEGCASCYARERLLPRLVGAFPARYGTLITRAPDGADRCRQWTGAMAIWPDRLIEPIRRRSGGRCFVCSQSDLFHEDRPEEHIAAVFAIMAMCPRMTFLVLTKRAERMQHWVELYRENTIKQLHDGLQDSLEKDPTPIVDSLDSTQLDLWIEKRLYAPGKTWPLPNVWLGVSVENQERANERITPLQATLAAKRFVSYEPALEPVDLRNWMPALDWVIAGAESIYGKRPGRPADLTWFRAVRDQCKDAGVAFFLKQMEQTVKSKTGRDMQRIVGTPELDGRRWTEVPQ